MSFSVQQKLLQSQNSVIITDEVFFTMEINLILFSFCDFVSFQFWAAYVPCEAQYKDAVQITLEQIDVIERLTDRYSPQMKKCSSVYGN